MGLKRSTRWCCSMFFLSLLFWVFSGELGIFYLYSYWWTWPQPPWPIQKVMSQHYSDNDMHYFTSRTTTTSRDGNGRQWSLLRMLFISDPHIMCSCDRDEPWLARWDADHYLRKSFSFLSTVLTPSHHTPHSVIILGDVFSDGFRASEEEWKDYLKCLHTTFSIGSPSSDVIVAMGDNDIGGEGRDHMSDSVIRRYRDSFGKMNSILRFGNVQIIKLTTVCFINSSPKTQPESDCRQELTNFLDEFKSARFSSPSTNTPNITILLSHVPLDDLQSTTNIKTKILSSLRPNFVFSGHIHHEKYTIHSIVPEGRRNSLPNDKKLEGFTHEITVPTCSYRMGQRQMGAGAAVVGENGDLAYRVLWLPPRYPFFIAYIIHVVLFVCATLVKLTFKRKYLY